MSTLFYGYGLGWFNRVGPLAGFLLAIVIWLAQVLLSNLWFRRFAFGPAEWLWRCLTLRPLVRDQRAARVAGYSRPCWLGEVRVTRPQLSW